MAKLHNEQNLEENCRRLITNYDEHIPIENPEDTLLNIWMHNSKHQICLNCFTTTIVKDFTKE